MKNLLHCVLGEMCIPNPCGPNAICSPQADENGFPTPGCTCPEGYVGDGDIGCQLGECINHSDCDNNASCYLLKCVDPCIRGVCGIHATCTVYNHAATCMCSDGYIGDPLLECILDPSII